MSENNSPKENPESEEKEITEVPEKLTAVTQKMLKPIRRLSVGSSAILQIVLLAITVIAINYISCGKNKQFDLTGKSDFTLSERTLTYLKQPDITSGEQPIKIIAIINEGEFLHLEENVPLRIRKTIEEYKQQSDGKIEIEYVNPLIDASRLEEISSTYSLSLIHI